MQKYRDVSDYILKDKSKFFKMGFARNPPEADKPKRRKPEFRILESAADCGSSSFSK